MDIIGEKIKKKIIEARFSVNEIAKRLNTTSQNMYKIFKKDSVESKYLEQIAEILEITISDFFNETIKDENQKLLNDKISLLTQANKYQEIKNTNLTYTIKHLLPEILNYTDKFKNEKSYNNIINTLKFHKEDFDKETIENMEKLTGTFEIQIGKK